MDQQSLLRRAARYETLFRKHGDRERIDKISLFAEKLLTGQYTIGFAGHFSAGKSSMINALTDEQLLPTSPIPTSANIVNVRKSDEDYVILHRMEGRPLKYEGDDFSEAIKAFGKDGENVARIDIGHVQSKLPEGVTVMDTPGVDSTDEAHALSTESSLHLSDLVFYTMDYNHVQSELNFRFTKELMNYNPNVYLIVNQVDKHRDEELSFEEFKSTVVESFRLWGVEPKDIFYTSLMKRDLPYNDFERVKAVVDKAMNNREEQLLHNAEQTLKKLYDEHVAYLKKEQRELKENNENIREEEWNQLDDLTLRLKEAKEERALKSGATFKKEFDDARNDLIASAAITPFDMREALREYVESKAPKFKVGLLFTKKKTEEERERRRRVLARMLDELIETQITMHVKTLMKNALKRANLTTDERIQEIDQYDWTMPFEKIDQHLTVTSAVSGDMVLNYSKMIRNSIDTFFRHMTEDWRDRMAEEAETSGSSEMTSLNERIEEYEQKVNAVKRYVMLEEAMQSFTKELETTNAYVEDEMKSLLQKWQQPVQYEIVDSYEQLEEQEDIEEETWEEEDVMQVDVEHIIEEAERVATAIKPLPQLEEMSTYLHTKADRLNKQEFTVALFGAFSAGKSSFSNALIGDKALPVSPNPTTAAINRIRPVTEQKQHRHADVHLKTADMMLLDVANSFEALGLTVQTLEEAKNRAKEALNVELEDESLHVHKSFIRAYAEGYEDYMPSLGETLYVAQEEFTKFVAEERRSCFVESIDFYFDSPLTRQGITLVDTPGADSINARHTDVAFEYIRNADAILFVTYYNHAFARADREFLIQLGRVKDAFEMDKMFFIVNAIDLAQNDEEAEDVKKFVARELATFGIRRPRIYGVSSLEALQAKQKEEDYPLMDTFEEEFYHFLEDDLRGMAAQALQDETEKTVDHVTHQIARTEENRERKDERLAELKTVEDALQNRFSESFAKVLAPTIKQEVEELVYYVHQRVFLRFNDFFREAYNPFRFHEQSSSVALQRSLETLLQMLSFDFTQELKVTNFRIAQFIERQLGERERREQQKLHELDEALLLTPYEMTQPQLLTFEEPFQSDQPYAPFHRHFKNGRQFFEEGGRQQMGEQLEAQLKEDAHTYLQQEMERLLRWAMDILQREADALSHHFQEETTAQIKAEYALLHETDELDRWKNVLRILKEGELQ